MRNDLKGAEHTSRRGQRAAVFRADGAGPNHVEVPRKRRVVPAPDVAQDCGLKFRHDVQGDECASSLHGPPAAEGQGMVAPGAGPYPEGPPQCGSLVFASLDEPGALPPSLLAVVALLPVSHVAAVARRRCKDMVSALATLLGSDGVPDQT